MTWGVVMVAAFMDFLAAENQGFYYYNAKNAQGTSRILPIGDSSGTRIQEALGMDADTILRIRPMLTEYLHEFDGCMGRITNHCHLQTYVSGQLGDLERKSIEPIADAAGVPPRTLQEFLSMLKWDDQAARDQVQRRVVRRHSHPHSIGVIGETSFHKQGSLRSAAMVWESRQEGQLCGQRPSWLCRG